MLLLGMCLASILHCASLLRIILRIYQHALKDGGFFCATGPRHRVNRHFLENERGDLSFFFCCIKLSSEFLYVK